MPICPTTLTAMKSILGVVKKEQAPRPQVIFVSVDPGRDTPQMLDRYVRAFDPEFIGATASDDALAPLTRNLGVFYQRDDAGGKPHYTVDHTATLFLLDPKGRLRKTFSPPSMWLTSQHVTSRKPNVIEAAAPSIVRTLPCYKDQRVKRGPGSLPAIQTPGVQGLL